MYIHLDPGILASTLGLQPLLLGVNPRRKFGCRFLDLDLDPVYTIAHLSFAYQPEPCETQSMLLSLHLRTKLAWMMARMPVRGPAHFPESFRSSEDHIAFTRGLPR